MNVIKNTANNLATLTLLICIAFSLWQVHGVGVGDFDLILLTLFGVVSGCVALTCLRPQRVGLSPPNVMLSLGIGGMLFGLFLDINRTPIATLENLCFSSSPLSLMESMLFHNSLFPNMHIGMVLGGILAIPTLRLLRPECRRLCSMLTQNILCSTWMLIGMTFGATAFVQSIRSIDGMSIDKMLGGMFTGMVWGMVISVGIYRLFFICKDQIESKSA